MKNVITMQGYMVIIIDCQNVVIYGTILINVNILTTEVRF